MKSTYSNIHELEKDMERIKMLHSLKKITSDAAKSEIMRLERQLMSHVDKLPQHERELYRIRKEFGKEF